MRVLRCCPCVLCKPNAGGEGLAKLLVLNAIRAPERPRTRGTSVQMWDGWIPSSTPIALRVRVEEREELLVGERRVLGPRAERLVVPVLEAHRDRVPHGLEALGVLDHGDRAVGGVSSSAPSRWSPPSAIVAPAGRPLRNGERHRRLRLPCDH